MTHDECSLGSKVLGIVTALQTLCYPLGNNIINVPGLVLLCTASPSLVAARYAEDISVA